MIVQKIMYQCTVCGYVTQSAIDRCPSCNDGQGHKWDATNPYPYGIGTAADPDALPPVCIITGETK